MVIAHDDVGSGTPVLLVHSGVGDRRMWRAQSEVLARAHRVVAPDLAGFGDTPLRPGRLSNVDDLLALLDHLDIARVAVVGSSFGGRVAMQLTHAATSRVSSLVLLCPAYAGLEPTPNVQSFAQEEERLIEAGDLDAAVELNVSTWLGPAADEEARDLVRQMQRRAFEVQIPADEWPDPPMPADEEPDIAAFTTPTHVVFGGQDLDHFQLIAHHLAATIPDAHLIELEWAGHLPNLERPGETTALLAGLLAEPSAAT